MSTSGIPSSHPPLSTAGIQQQMGGIDASMTYTMPQQSTGDFQSFNMQGMNAVYFNPRHTSACSSYEQASRKLKKSDYQSAYHFEFLNILKNLF